MSQNQIIGTQNNDVLLDTILDDQIFALDGDDEIEVSLGNDFVDGGEGNDKLTINYSASNEDLGFYLNTNFNGFSNDGSLEVNSYLSDYNSWIDFYSIESFAINSGSGNDFIDLGYDNYSDDEVNAGAGDDFIFAGLGNDTIDGGAGFDWLRLDFTQSQTGFTSFLTDSDGGEYSDGINTVTFSNIEAVDIFGSYYDDVLVAVSGDNTNESPMYSMNSMVDGNDGIDQLVLDYSHLSEDLNWNLFSNYYGNGDGSLEVNSYLSDYNSWINFYSIESFAINSGSGNDGIDLGYDNYSDDEVNAGAGDDFIFAGLGNDTIDGGAGFDWLRLDFTQSQTGVTSFLTDSDSGEYSDGINTINFSKIEAVEVFGSNYDDVLVAFTGDNANEPPMYPMNSMVDGKEGEDRLVADYSQRTEDLMFYFNFYGNGDGSLEVNSYLSDYNSRIDFHSIESFAINSGSGHDFIDLGYDNYSDDRVDAGAGDDFIFAGFGNDTIDGGLGNDTFVYELGAGIDVIYDSSGDSDTIILGYGITLDNLNIEFNNSDLIFSFNDFPEDKLILENYVDSIDKIENVEIEGQLLTLEELFALKSIPDVVNDRSGNDFITANLGDEDVNGGAGYDVLMIDFYQSPTNIVSFLTNNHSGQYSNGIKSLSFSNIEAIHVFGSNYDDVLVTLNAENHGDYELTNSYPVTSFVDGGEGYDQLVADYSERAEDLMFMLNNYGGSGSIDVHSYMGGYNSRVDFNSIESFVINSGSGNDNIELGYDNYSDDEVNAGAGDDLLFAGLGNDTIDGGAGFDVLRLDFNQSQTGVTSFLTDSGSGEYSDGINTINFSKIEAVEVFGSNYDDVLVAIAGDNTIEPTMYPMNSWVDGFEGEDQLVVDYSHLSEDLVFMLNNYGGSGSIDVHSYMGGYNSRVDFNSIESLVINSGSGNDGIDLGYDNYSDDRVHAGAGDDFIFAGLGNDTIDGGAGFDLLRLDFNFTQIQTGVTSFLTDSGSGEYSDGINTVTFSNIEAVDIIGSYYDDVLVAIASESVDGTTVYPMNSMIDGGEGYDQLVVDYSEQTEDLNFWLNGYGNGGSLEINSYMTNYYSQIGINNIESLIINSGSGNDFIDLGFSNFSDDLIDAGAGDDWLFAGFGNDTLQGGLGNDTYIYEPGDGVNVISDVGGENDTVIFNGISLDNLNWHFNDNDLIFNLTNPTGGQLIIENYTNSLDSIENIDVGGQTLSIEELLAPQTIGEFGQVTNFNHNSQTIQLDNSYLNPVVFALPLSRNGGDPAIVRITDIQSDNFTAYLQEPEYKDGGHINESFSYLVLEAGTWELDNGTLLEVGEVYTNLVTTQGWENIDFNADFKDTPVILSQVQTNADSQFVRTRQNQASIDGFRLSMEEEEALKSSGHGTETVGWLAIDSGQGKWGELEYQAGHTPREVNHNKYNLNFTQDFTDTPSLLASVASIYGSDPSGLRYQNLSNTQVQIVLEEDQSLDSEIDHTKEIVDFLAISGTGDLTAIAYEPMNII